MNECERTTLHRRGDPESSKIGECSRAPRLGNERFVNQSSSVGLDLAEGLSIWRDRRPLRRGDFQLMSQHSA